MGEYRRDNGKRGELDVEEWLRGSARRVGHSYIVSPVDVETGVGVHQIRNRTVGGSEIDLKLARLKAFATRNAHVRFKVKGKWFVAEPMDQQHVDDHGDVLVKNRPEEE